MGVSICKVRPQGQWRGHAGFWKAALCNTNQGGRIMAMIAPARDVSVYVKLALVAVAWGGTFIAGRSLAGVAPMFSACLRFVLASAALSLFLLLSGKGFKRVNVRQTLVVTLLGFCGIFS